LTPGEPAAVVPAPAQAKGSARVGLELEQAREPMALEPEAQAPDFQVSAADRAVARASRPG
jgi:hypothetical protein